MIEVQTNETKLLERLNQTILGITDKPKEPQQLLQSECYSDKRSTPNCLISTIIIDSPPRTR